MPRSERARSGWFGTAGQVALLLCTLALLAGNFLLIRQNDRLRRDEALRTRSMAPQAGLQLEPLRGVARNGDTIALDYQEDQRQTLLVVFSTECSISQANWPYWRELVSKVDKARFRVALVNLSDSVPDSYAQTYSIPDDIPLIAKVDPIAALQHNLSLSPNLVLVGNDGVIEDTWLGSELQTRRSALERTLGL